MLFVVSVLVFQWAFGLNKTLAAHAAHARSHRVMTWRMHLVVLVLIALTLSILATETAGAMQLMWWWLFRHVWWTL